MAPIVIKSAFKKKTLWLYFLIYVSKKEHKKHLTA